MLPEIRLEVDGVEYGGWQEVALTRRLDHIAGGFTLAVSEVWPGQDTAYPIPNNSECRVLADGAVVFTGYVETRTSQYDHRQHRVSVSGRDLLGDLIDCTVPLENQGLGGLTLLEAAKRLCTPYGITVRAEVDVGAPFMNLHPNECETVFSQLDAGAKIRGVLLTGNADGALVITRASTERLGAVLCLGDNVLRSSERHTMNGRFSSYTVIGQRERQDGDAFEDAYFLRGTEQDRAIARHRPLVIQVSNLSGADDAARRAKWERNVRYGRSRQVTYTVSGWHYEPGKLWPVNRLVAVRDDLRGIDEDLLISAVSYRLDEQGAVTEIEVVPREAFDLTELPELGDKWARL